MSTKFDLILERAFKTLIEGEYIESTFSDNIRLLVKALADNDYLPTNKNADDIARETIAQPQNVKEITLDTQEKSLPPFKLHVNQESDSESFSVTVINLDKPEEQKEFTNDMLETIFANTMEYIKTAALQGLKPENAVNELPPAEGANAQPGGGESALPTSAPAPAPTAPNV